MTEPGNPEGNQPSDVVLTDIALDSAVAKWQPIIEELIDDKMDEVPGRAFTTSYGGITTQGIVFTDEMPTRSPVARTSVWLMDEDGAGDFVGYGILSVTADTETPFVGDTFTNQEYRRGGLAKRRLEVMNKVATELFGNVLHSSQTPVPEPEAIAVWEKLEAEGRAESFDTPKGKRWKFRA